MSKVAEGPNDESMQKGVQQFNVHADAYSCLQEPSTLTMANSSSPNLLRFD